MKNILIYTIIAIMFFGIVSCEESSSSRKTAYDAKEYIIKHQGTMDIRVKDYATSYDLIQYNMGTGFILEKTGEWNLCDSDECNYFHVYNGDGNDIKQRLEEVGYSASPPIILRLGAVVAEGHICKNDVLLIIPKRMLGHDTIIRLFNNFCKQPLESSKRSPTL